MNRDQIKKAKDFLRHQAMLGDPSFDAISKLFDDLERELLRLQSAHTEMAAWHWLLDLPRIDVGNQIIVQVMPGEFGATSGAPLVQLSVLFPGVNNRAKAQGNTLLDCVKSIRDTLASIGIDLPSLSDYD